MDGLHWLFFLLRYTHHPPWESDVVPPEVATFIATHSPGPVLDLGCGTGTSCLAFARAGWQVTGVDFIPRAIRKARQKAIKESLQIEFLSANVTRLPARLFQTPHSLVLDIGCFHGLPPSEKRKYIDQLPRLLAPDGIWLLYGFIIEEDDNQTGTPGLVIADLERAQNNLRLLDRQDGMDRGERASAWFWFKRIVPNA